MTAIAYAIPGRIEDSAGCRAVSTIGAPTTDGPPLVTWPELRALQASGVVDVQCHTYSHSKVFCSAAVAGYVTPDYESTPLLNRPSIADSPTPQIRIAIRFGERRCIWPGHACPMACASRSMLTFVPDASLASRAVAIPRFFDRPSWREELDAIARDAPARSESEDARRTAIEEELDRGRSVLNDALRTQAVNHVCLPWGVSSADSAAALKRLGFRTAFANRLRGVHAVRQGDDPYWLKRLPK